MNDWLKDDEEDCWGDDGLLKIRVTREKKKAQLANDVVKQYLDLNWSDVVEGTGGGAGGAEALRVKACGGGGS